MAKILGTSLPAGHVGNLVTTYARVSRGTPEDAALPYGALVKFGSSTGYYDVYAGSETSAADFAGVIVRDMTHIEYDGTVDSIAPGKDGDVLLEGDIWVEVDSEVTDLATIVEGGKVYLGAAGKASSTGGEGAVEIARCKFLGMTSTVDGVKITAIRVRFSA